MIEWIKYNIYAHEVRMEKILNWNIQRKKGRNTHTRIHSQLANKIEETPESWCKGEGAGEREEEKWNKWIELIANEWEIIQTNISDEETLTEAEECLNKRISERPFWTCCTQ